VPGTKFVWPDPGPKYAPVNLTSQKEEHWKKWIGLYNEKMLSKGNFLDLYVYGYDSPEAYAIEKDGKMYYAFFAGEKGSFSGEVELRGLTAGLYRVMAYVDGKDMGVVGADATRVPKLKVEFKDHLLLELTKKSL
jgi:alpha-galactosidase